MAWCHLGHGQVASFCTQHDGARLPDVAELYRLHFKEDLPHLPCQPRSHRERFLPHHASPTPRIPHTSAGRGKSGCCSVSRLATKQTEKQTGAKGSRRLADNHDHLLQETPVVFSKWKILIWKKTKTKKTYLQLEDKASEEIKPPIGF